MSRNFFEHRPRRRCNWRSFQQPPPQGLRIRVCRRYVGERRRGRRRWGGGGKRRTEEREIHLAFFYYSFFLFFFFFWLHLASFSKPPILVASRDYSCWGVWLLTVVAWGSVALECRLMWHMGSAAPSQHVESPAVR